MKLGLFGLAAAAALAAGAGPASAQTVVVPAPYAGPAYYRAHGVRFSGGYYYPGRSHPHWAYRAWDARHHRYNYYDPYLRCYYHWYAPGGCWYPGTYCP